MRENEKRNWFNIKLLSKRIFCKLNLFFSQENRLNYADVVFQPTSRNEVRIIGLEDRTVYADVDTYGAGALLPETRSETSSSEDDFVYVDGIENFIEKRETND